MSDTKKQKYKGVSMDTIERKIALNETHCHLCRDDSGTVHLCPFVGVPVGSNGFTCQLLNCILDKRDGEDAPVRDEWCKKTGNRLHVVLTNHEVLPLSLHDEQKRQIVAERMPNCMIKVTPVGSDREINMHIQEFNRRIGSFVSRAVRKRPGTVRKKPGTFPLETQKRRDHRDQPVDSIRELGFDDVWGVVGNKKIFTEKLFFIDACGAESFNATDRAIKEAINRWKHNTETLELYLKNGKNNNTHEWKVCKEHSNADKAEKVEGEIASEEKSIPRKICPSDHDEWGCASRECIRTDVQKNSEERCTVPDERKTHKECSNADDEEAQS